MEEAMLKKGLLKKHDDLWAAVLAQQLAEEIGLPVGNMWVPGMAKRLERMVAQEGWSRRRAEAAIRLSLGLEEQGWVYDRPTCFITWWSRP